MNFAISYWLTCFIFDFDLGLKWYKVTVHKVLPNTVVMAHKSDFGVIFLLFENKTSRFLPVGPLLRKFLKG